MSVPWTATAPWLARERTESLADCFSRALPTVMAESSEDEGRLLLLNALVLAVVGRAVGCGGSDDWNARRARQR